MPSNKPPQVLVSFTGKELATVLAALRNWQEMVLSDEHLAAGVAHAFPHFEDVDPLSLEEVDELCEVINGGVEFYAAHHYHREGRTSCFFSWTGNQSPTQWDVALGLDLNYQPDRRESIEIDSVIPKEIASLIPRVAESAAVIEHHGRFWCTGCDASFGCFDDAPAVCPDCTDAKKEA